MTPAVAPSPRSLVVVLLPSLNAGGLVRATEIRSARLLDPSGNIVAVGKHAGSTAEFALGTMQSIDHFLRINALQLDVVPVPMQARTPGVIEFVSTTMDRALVGNPENPDHLVRTWGPWQGEPPVVRYSDGSAATPERHAYAVVSLTSDPPRVETRVLGTAELLTSVDAPKGVHDPATWLIGSANHGRQDPSTCDSCHGNLGLKPRSYGEIRVAHGFCFACHHGPAGPAGGMVAPAL